MQEYTKTFDVGGVTLTFRSGKLAKQADGATLIQLGETVVLTAAVGARSAREELDFFPLTVDYRERASAAGRFPGGYHKREGRPTEKEILTCRLTDRPIRPLFPKGWFNEVQVQSMVLSADGENDPDILSILGASVALTLSDLPWSGPLGALRVGRIQGEFVAFPTHSQMEDSDLDLIYVGNKNDVVMYEGSAKEISEADFNAALAFAQEHCLPIIEAQEQLAAEMKISKREVVVSEIPDQYVAAARDVISEKIIQALLIEEKLPREKACSALKDELGAALVAKFGEESIKGKVVGEIFYKLQKEQVRQVILDKKKRLDGRDFNALRPIFCEVGVLPRTHGSAVFTRGETQALACATLGTNEDSQEFDSYTGGVTEKKFFLHYSFPNYSVGEVGRISGPGRREIGHGALAERSVAPVIPVETFPYSIRVTSDILESNGSSSMGSVCAASLALMDAGVPLEKAVAGISVGICTETDSNNNIDRYQLLTDIIGWEDAFCDMDCKIAGTRDGITGFQLDLKLPGIPLSIMQEAVESARIARLQILDIMAETIATPREQLSKYAPRIEIIKINPDKIGLLIGPGGKNIKALVEKSGCEINIEDDGSVFVYSIDQDGMEIARNEIMAMTAEIEEGTIYRGRVVSIKEFGCFVEVLPGKEGLCHVSELANFRVKRPSDIVKEGDEIVVKCIGVDEKGRVRLSRKAAMADRDDSYKLDAQEDEDEDNEAPVRESAPRSRGRRPQPAARGNEDEPQPDGDEDDEDDDIDSDIEDEDFDDEDDFDEDEDDFDEDEEASDEPVETAPRGRDSGPGRGRSSGAAPSNDRSRGRERSSSSAPSRERGGSGAPSRDRDRSSTPNRDRGGNNRGRSQSSTTSGTGNTRDRDRERDRAPSRDRGTSPSPRGRDRDAAPSRDRDSDRGGNRPSGRSSSGERSSGGGERSSSPGDRSRRPAQNPAPAPGRRPARRKPDSDSGGPRRRGSD